MPAPAVSSISPVPPRERGKRTASLVARLRAARCPAQAAAIRSELVLANRGVAEAVAGRYRGRGVPLEDLHQVAYEGLVRAVGRFEPEQGRDLLSFAVPTIRGTLQHYFRDQCWAVKPPRRIQELQADIRRASSEYAQDHGREPSDAQLIEVLAVERREFREAAAARGCFRPASLDVGARSGSSATRAETLMDDAATERATEARLLLAPLVAELSERDRQIVHLRFVEERTQGEIGDVLGVTQMQVSRLLTRILTVLRDALVNQDAPTMRLAS